MHTFQRRRALQISALLATAVFAAPAQTSEIQTFTEESLLRDQATSPEQSLRLDLSQPEHEPVPPGGFAAPDPRLFEEPAGGPSAAGQKDELPEGVALPRLEQLLVQPVTDVAEDGSVWVRTRGLRTHFESGGVTAYPVFGRTSPREWPVGFSLAHATVGGTSIASNSEARPRLSDTGDQITLDHGAVDEVWNLRLDAIEQTFVFEELPGSGDLVVDIAVDTDLAASVVGDEIVFDHGEFGGLRYGEAFVVDAAGRREAIARQFEGGTIRLTVPAAFLAEATLPVTIDPPPHVLRPHGQPARR